MKLLVFFSLINSYGMKDYKIKIEKPKRELKETLPMPVKYEYRETLVFSQISEDQVLFLKKENIRNKILIPLLKSFVPIVGLSFISNNTFFLLALGEILLGPNEINIGTITISFMFRSYGSQNSKYILGGFFLTLFLYLSYQYFKSYKITIETTTSIGVFFSFLILINYFYHKQDSLFIPLGFVFYSVIFVPLALDNNYDNITKNSIDNYYGIYYLV